MPDALEMEIRKHTYYRGQSKRVNGKKWYQESANSVGIVIGANPLDSIAMLLKLIHTGKNNPVGVTEFSLSVKNSDPTGNSVVRTESFP